jgi:hypothetical protein
MGFSLFVTRTMKIYWVIGRDQWIADVLRRGSGRAEINDEAQSVA